MVEWPWLFRIELLGKDIKIYLEKESFSVDGRCMNSGKTATNLKQRKLYEAMEFTYY